MGANCYERFIALQEVARGSQPPSAVHKTRLGEPWVEAMRQTSHRWRPVATSHTMTLHRDRFHGTLCRGEAFCFQRQIIGAVEWRRLSIRSASSALRLSDTCLARFRGSQMRQPDSFRASRLSGHILKQRNIRLVVALLMKMERFSTAGPCQRKELRGAFSTTAHGLHPFLSMWAGYSCVFSEIRASPGRSLRIPRHSCANCRDNSRALRLLVQTSALRISCDSPSNAAR